MTNKSRSSHKRSFLVLVASVLAATVLISGTALASNAQGPITQVEYNAGNSSNPQLLLQLNGVTSTNYFAQQGTPGCGVPALSIDSIKMFVSIAQAALLAGKTTTVYYNACGGLNYVYDVVMTR